jgi:hypothetical protein
MKSNENPEAQAIYEILLKDDRLQCTCGESCLVSGFKVDWGDRYKTLREDLRKRLEKFNSQQTKRDKP